MEPMDEFEKKLQNLKKPQVMTEHQAYLKLPILNTRKSAAMGWWLVALPCLLLACVVMQLVSGGSIRVLDMLFSTLEAFDRSHGGWFSPLVFVLFPMVAAGMNLLSLLNVLYDAERRELIITLKVRFWNLFLIFVGFGAALFIGFHALLQHFH